MFSLVLLLVVLIPAIQPVTDPDFWWHAATGNWILAHGAIPSHDLFTFTVPDNRWVTHEWLSEVLLASLLRIGGLALVSVVLGMVTWFGFVLVWRAVDRRVNFLIRGVVLMLGVAAANPILGPRIQMITFALAALTYLWIQRFWDGRSRALYWLPLLMVVWVNLHGGFVIAYVFLGIAFAVELVKYLLRRADAPSVSRLKHFALIGLGSVAAAMFNPNGWLIYPYALQTQASALQQRLIVEWHAPDFQSPEIRFFEATVFLLLIGVALGRSHQPRQFFLLLAGLGLALNSVRHLGLFPIVAVPLLADYAQQAWERIPRHRPRRLPANALTFAVNGLLLLTVLTTVSLALLPILTQRVNGRLITRHFPVQAASFLASHPPPGRMLNQFGWGGYLIFRLSPRQPVFIFGDAALMGDRLLKDYSDLVYLAPDEASLLDQHAINWAIFPSGDAIITGLRQNHNSPGHVGWFPLATLGDATIMMRDTLENRAYAAQAAP